MVNMGGLLARMIRTGMLTLFVVAIMALALIGCDQNCADCSDNEPACNHNGRCDTDESVVGCPDDCPAGECNLDGNCDTDENEWGCPEDCRD